MRAALAVALGVAACASGRADPPASTPAASGLCVTRGAIAADGAVDAPVFRAVAPGSDGDRAELAFTVRGPTATAVALASGAQRRQLGLKLRAADGCNLLYVMWRTEPTAALVVSIKDNPGAHTHAECGARGYRQLGSVPAPALVAGAAHTLRAAIDGDTLTAWIDGAEVWRGSLDARARGLRGPAGVRSDNLAWTGDLTTWPAPTAPTTPCARADGPD